MFEKIVNAKRLIAEVRENFHRLDGCSPPHDFQKIPPEPGSRLHKYRCQKCGGTIGAIDHLWYARGLEHGKSLKDKVDAD
jgi:hypothetical protein